VRISPVTSLASLSQGDVMISNSGNARLVLKVEKRPVGTMITFISRLRTGKVALESTQQDKVDLQKLESLVQRKAGNPLEKYSEQANALESERNILHNVKVLLQSGMLGGQLRSALRSLKRNEQLFVDIDLWVSAENGEIVQIGGEEPGVLCRLVSITVNCMNMPSQDYIKSARFDRNSEEIVKRNILAAAVIANTLENARNLANVAQMAGV